MIVKSTLAFLIAGCVALCCAQNASLPTRQASTVQRLIKFHGALADPQRAGVGTVNVRFTVYDQPYGGEACWQETQSVHPDAQGRYAVLLGETTPGGLPPDIFASLGTHWLEVQLAGQPTRPRIQLTELPSPTPQSDAIRSGTPSLQAAMPTRSSDRYLVLVLLSMFLAGMVLACSETIKWWKGRMEQYWPPPFASLIDYVRGPGPRWYATHVLGFPLWAPRTVRGPSQKGVTWMSRTASSGLASSAALASRIWTFVGKRFSLTRLPSFRWHRRRQEYHSKPHFPRGGN